MPASPALAHGGFGVIAAIAMLALLASVLTLVASVLLVWRYRRAVARLMAAEGAANPAALARDARMGREIAPVPSHIAPAEAIAALQLVERGRAERLYRRTISDPRRHACKYALAAAFFALLMGLSALVAFSQIQINPLRAAGHPLQFAFLFWTFFWPAVLTLNMMSASRRSRWLTAAVYFIVLTGLGALAAFAESEPPFRAGSVDLPAWSGETPFRLASKWLLFNLAPTVLIVLFRQRPLRAVAPLVLSFMTVVAAGVLGVMSAAFVHQALSIAIATWLAERLGVHAGAALGIYLLLLGILACCVFAALGWLLLSWLRSRYRSKAASDQSLAIDALWLIFATFYAALLAVAGPAWALAAVLAFVAFKLAARAGERLLRPTDGGAPPGPTLLVLRVFSLGRRSEILFETLTRRWRYIGSVNLIAGTDLALSTVAPHQFLAFVGGRLDRLFIRDAAAIERSVRSMDGTRDADARFRINDFFCHADTWQALLVRLLGGTDAVLMDLRGLSTDNAGCIYEIEQLLLTIPVERLVFIVDAKSDREVLKAAWQTACAARSESPNCGLAFGALRLFELAALDHSALQSLMQRLCAAASHARIGRPPLGAADPQTCLG